MSALSPSEVHDDVSRDAKAVGPVPVESTANAGPGMPRASSESDRIEMVVTPSYAATALHKEWNADSMI